MRLHLGARLLDRHAVLQPRDAANEVTAAIGLRRIEPKRREHIGRPLGIDLEMAERRRQHADHRGRHRVDRDRLTDDRGIGAVAAAPEAVADQRDASRRRGDRPRRGTARPIAGWTCSVGKNPSVTCTPPTRSASPLSAGDRRQPDPAVGAHPRERRCCRARSRGSRPATGCRARPRPCRSRRPSPADRRLDTRAAATARPARR